MFEEMNVNLRNALTCHLEILIHKFHALLSLLVSETILIGEQPQEDDIDIERDVEGCDEGEHPLVDQHVAEHGNKCDLELVLYPWHALSMSRASKVIAH